MSKWTKLIQKYPSNIKPYNHYGEYNGKYIIDGIHGEIILLDPETHSFCKKTNIPKLGSHSNDHTFDKIHIFNGDNNKHHLIYDELKEAINHKINSQRIMISSSIKIELLNLVI